MLVQHMAVISIPYYRILIPFYRALVPYRKMLAPLCTLLEATMLIGHRAPLPEKSDILPMPSIPTMPTTVLASCLARMATQNSRGLGGTPGCQLDC